MAEDERDLDKTNGVRKISRFAVSKRSVVQTFQQEDEEEEVEVEKTTFDKFINYIFCRSDLATETLKARPVSLAGLFRFSTRWDIFLLISGMVGAIISGCCQPILAVLAGGVVNLLLTLPPNSTDFRDQAYHFVYAYFGLGIFVLFINFVQFMCFQHVCCRLIAQLRHQYMKSLLRQNCGWFDRNQCGKLTTQLNDNVERIREGIGDKLGILVRGFAMFGASLVVAFIYEWRLALFMSPVAVLTCACMSLMSRKMADATSRELKDVGNAGSIAEEAVLGVRTVQAFNGQKEMVQRYQGQLGNGSTHAVNKSVWGGILGGFFYVILFSFLGSGMLFGGHLLRIGVMHNPGDVLTSVLAVLFGAYFLGLISPHLMVVLNARVAASVIYATIDRRPPIDVYSDSGKIPMDVVGRIEFQAVHFRYPTRRDVKVLNGLNLTINAGETVALVGHSGCGKSTSVGLLTRLYEAESGRVLLDASDVRELNIEWLRNITGIVQQEPNLFNDTIAENLRIGCPKMTQADMISVCKMANAHDFIMKLPKGYNTLIGDGGVQLSGGQKQRVAIARTLARNPRVLLLDEATSALDAQSESIVQEALDTAAAGRTTIVIAHRLSTVRNADKIVVFDHGNIVEQGTHSELLEADGHYAQLVKAQQFTPETEPDTKTTDNVDDEVDVVDVDGPQPRTFSRQTSTSEYIGGSDEFVRGCMANDSSRNSARMMTSGDMIGAMEGGDKFAEQVRLQMEQDGEISAGLFTIYRNGRGNYYYMFFAFATAMIRGLELPFLAITFEMVYSAFDLYVIDPWRMQHELVISLIVFVCIGIGTFIFHTIASIMFGIISERMTLSFRVRTFENILSQDAAYFDNPQHAPGRLITRLASDAPNVKAVIDGRMMYVVFNLTAWFINLIVGFTSAWPIGLLGLLLSTLLGFIMVTLSQVIQRKNLSLMKKNQAGKFSIEIIENVRTIQLLTREKYFFQKYEEASKRQKRNEMYKGYFEGISYAISQTFIYFAMGSAYGVGIALIYNGYFASNVTYRAVLSTMMACFGVMNCSSFFPEFVKAKTAAGMLFNMIERKATTGDVMKGEKTKLRGNILFEQAHFVYPQRPHQPVLKGLQFTAKKGQTIALVGPSGSGKSTVISLLERFYDVTGGAVRIDGVDLRKLSLHHLRTQMALVGQEPRLFSGTIRDNICFGMEDVSDLDVRNALELSNSATFVSGLPQGLDTEVGEKGTQLSGGQKQRIAIARALVRDPVVLLLDEATSALDSQSERAVQEALDRAREGRTCITIAHRLSSIQNADLIVFVENGIVRESGSHSQLMAARGRYYEMIKKQDLST